jgi:hypothetical protein
MWKIRYPAVFAVLFLLMFFTGCANDPLSASITVKYQVSGTAVSADVDYIDQNGELAIINNVALPWTITFTRDKGDTVYLSAQNTGTTGTVIVEIFSNGTLFDTDTSSDSTAATAEGTL